MSMEDLMIKEWLKRGDIAIIRDKGQTKPVPIFEKDVVLSGSNEYLRFQLGDDSSSWIDAKIIDGALKVRTPGRMILQPASVNSVNIYI
jgi:hypothetical protein